MTLNSSVVVQGMTVKLRPCFRFREVWMRLCQVESTAGKGVVGLLSWHGSYFWVCITFCKVHHSDSFTKPDYYYYAPDAQTNSHCQSLPCLTTSATLCIPKRLFKSTLHFLSLSDTPHIHLAIIRSVFSRLCRFSVSIAQVLVPCVNTLWTQAMYIFPFMWCDAPQAVRIGENSLNTQAHLTHI